MNVLEDIQFEKSLPRENRKQILNKIASFLRDWESNPNRSEVSSLHSIKKVKGHTKLKEVWKFKVSGGDRILFTRGRFAALEGQGNEEAIVLLRFCNHDEQIVKARRLSKVTADSGRHKEDSQEYSTVLEEIIEQLVDKEAEEIEYNPEKAVTRVFKHISIEELVDIDSLQGIFYLNEEQRACVNADYRPMLLFGSAGSGKTTIGVYKLIDLLKQNPEIKVGYFTYSSQLAKSAQQIFETVLRNETGEKSCFKEQVDFYPLKEWLKDRAKAGRLVQYDHFIQDFYFELRQNLSMHPDYKKVILKLSGYEIWREIRGLIKGFARENWQVNLAEGEGGILSLEEYLRLGKNYTSFSEEERKVIYEVALRYMAWLRKEGRMDENDLCRAILRGDDKDRFHYDWIVIDEVQDLTELEIYLLHTLVSFPGNFLMSGDYHQTIAPTFFDSRRIMSLLEHQQFRYQEDANRFVLTRNYRNPKQIVGVANHLSSLRTELFGQDKRNDYALEVPVKKSEGTLLTLCRQPEEKMKLLAEAVKKAYAYIVVATEEEKKKLEEALEHNIRIFTVYEVKGLENRMIIGVNLLSHFKEKWQMINRHQNQGEALAESHLYRYLLNMLYVTLTRTQENLCLIEDEVEAEFITELFKGNWQHQKAFDEISFGLGEHSSLEDFYQEALKFEAAEDYERAIRQYEKLNLDKAQLRINFCQGRIREAEGYFAEAARLYEAAAEKLEAARCFRKAGNMRRFYEVLLDADEEQFKKEVLYNIAIDYDSDLKPYIKGRLKEKLEALTLKCYSRKLQAENEDLDFSLLCAEELHQSVKKAEEKLKQLIK